MSNDVLNVLAGKPLATGGVLRDPSSATGRPVDAVTPLVGPIALGYIGEDGLTETIDRSTDKVKAWGGDVVKVVQTDFSVSYAFTFYESINANVLKAVHGDGNVDLTPATAAHGTRTTTKINSEELPKSEWFFEVRDGQAKIRIYVPIGQITAVGEVNYNDGAVIGYPVTLEAFPDSDGNQAYKMTDDGRKAAA
jgi:hypothetical protein